MPPIVLEPADQVSPLGGASMFPLGAQSALTPAKALLFNATLCRSSSTQCLNRTCGSVWVANVMAQPLRL